MKSKPKDTKSLPFVSIKDVGFTVTLMRLRRWIPKAMYRRVIEDMYMVEFSKDGETFIQLIRGNDLVATDPNTIDELVKSAQSNPAGISKEGATE